MVPGPATGVGFSDTKAPWGTKWWAHALQNTRATANTCVCVCIFMYIYMCVCVCFPVQRECVPIWLNFLHFGDRFGVGAGNGHGTAYFLNFKMPFSVRVQRTHMPLQLMHHHRSLTHQHSRSHQPTNPKIALMSFFIHPMLSRMLERTQSQVVVTMQRPSGARGGFYTILRGALDIDIEMGGIKVPRNATLKLQKV